MSKKKWTKPKLIVLVRGRPEETALFGCKGDGPGGMSPQSHWMGCKHDAFPDEAYCGNIDCSCQICS